MCGVAGFVDSSLTASDAVLAATVRGMADALRHRGPDDAGVWTDAAAGIALGHRRLSIIDLSPAGHQPMASSDGRYVIAYNGETYNFKDVRSHLERQGRRFRGHSDTEVILEGCAVWGVGATVRRLTGMFAFALWDRKEQTLYLVRDRLGIKPIYWARQGPLCLFGSQLGALRMHPSWRAEIDRDALAGFMRSGYVPAPLSIYKNVHKLMPGHILALRPGGAPELDCYWDVRAVARRGFEQRKPIADAEAVEQLDGLLRDAVRSHMVADVPLGAFLSGGIDSSTVVALMQAQSGRPIKTFSIGFNEAQYNEAKHAKAVAKHLGTDHTELYVSPADAMAVIPRLPEIFDEPFADSSQIPTYLVCELARRSVTVSLSGDGGDESFAGYTRYDWSVAWWRRIGPVPLAARQSLSALIRGISQPAWDGFFSLVPTPLRPSTPGRKLHGLADLLRRETADALYRYQHTHWPEPELVVPGAHEPQGPLWDPTVADDVPDFRERMQLLDMLVYLPDDILAKVDRASMAVSLETRVPLLDHRVVEFAWQLPYQLKVRDGVAKWLLRQVLYRYVPAKLIERPKMGFGVPIEHWLRGALRDWAEDLLSEERLRRDGFFDPHMVRQKWMEHLDGRGAWQYLLWNVLMFQAWQVRQAA